jgi:hypothetical protein
MEQSRYIAGVCNIGEAEIAQRKRVGYVALVVTLIGWALLWYSGVPALWRLVLIIPASMSATGFLQGFMQFCAGFGMRGVFNFGPEIYKTETVKDAEALKKDKRKAQQIFLYSVLIGLVVALVAYFL